MGNEVAVIDRQQNVPAFTLSDMERIASSIARGGMFGSKDPHAVLTLCMLAQAEGQHPAVVFRDYDIIQGKPAKKAEAMLRDFIGSGGKVTWNRLDDECADATFSHPLGGTVTINWTFARASKAGLGSKDMWKKYPRQMLRSRVVSEGVRTVCPTATSGLYVPEEVRDFDNTTASDTPATPEPKRARDLKAEAPKEIEAKPEDQARAKAEAWTEEFIGKLADADLPETEALFAKASNAIAKLERDHPDLHAEVMKHAPTPPDEPESDEPSAADEAVQKVIAAADAAKDEAELEKLIKDAEGHKMFMPEDLQIKLEVAFDKNRKRLAGAKAEPAGAK